MGIRLKPSGNLTTKGGIAIKKSGRTQSEESTLHTAASIPTALSKAQAKFFEYSLNLRPSGHATVVI
jgi:hypothetical protein